MRRENPAAVHVDGTARPQILTEEANPQVLRVLMEYKEQTGRGTIINTSFNMHRRSQSFALRRCCSRIQAIRFGSPCDGTISRLARSAAMRRLQRPMFAPQLREHVVESCWLLSSTFSPHPGEGGFVQSGTAVRVVVHVDRMSSRCVHAGGRWRSVPCAPLMPDLDDVAHALPDMQRDAAARLGALLAGTGV